MSIDWGKAKIGKLTAINTGKMTYCDGALITLKRGKATLNDEPMESGVKYKLRDGDVINPLTSCEFV